MVGAWKEMITPAMTSATLRVGWMIVHHIRCVLRRYGPRWQFCAHTTSCRKTHTHDYCNIYYDDAYRLDFSNYCCANFAYSVGRFRATFALRSLITESLKPFSFLRRPDVDVRCRSLSMMMLMTLIADDDDDERRPITQRRDATAEADEARRDAGNCSPSSTSARSAI